MAKGPNKKDHPVRDGLATSYIKLYKIDIVNQYYFPR